MKDSVKKHLKKGLIALLIVLGIFYAYMQTKDMLFGPRIEVFNLENGQLIEEEIITVRGKAQNSNQIFFNNRKVFLNDQMEFEEQLLPLQGYNIINIRAIDRFENETEKNIEIVYQPK